MTSDSALLPHTGQMEDSLHTVITLPISLLSEMLNQVPLKRASFRGGANARTKKISSVCGVCGRDFPLGKLQTVGMCI